MPTYQYTAKNLNGKKIVGSMDAADERQLITRLQADALYVLSWRVSDPGTNKVKLKALELSDFSRQIGTMLASGVSLLRAIQIISQRNLTKRVQTVYQNLYYELQRGASLSEAMQKQNGAFPELLINMFIAGESSGGLDRTAMKMAVHYEKDHQLQTKVRNALIYPIILLCVTVIVMLGIFTFVLPRFFTMFDSIPVLPFPTQVVMGISNGLTHHWFAILMVLIVCIILFGLVFPRPQVRHAIDKQKLKLPVIGNLLQIIYTARFARTLSSLYSSGLSMLNALTISRGIIGNRYIAGQFDEVLTRIRQGASLSATIALIDGFDSKLASTILVGEETGKLDNMLETVADSFDYESEMATQRLATIVEPVLIIIMAFIIGFIMVSVMLPIYDMYNTIGQ